jgi:hypothetical protein
MKEKDLAMTAVSSPSPSPASQSSDDPPSSIFHPRSLALHSQSSVLSPNHLLFQIADIPILLTSEIPDLKLKIEGAKKDFLINEADPDVTVGYPGDLSKATWGESSSTQCPGKCMIRMGLTFSGSPR